MGALLPTRLEREKRSRSVVLRTLASRRTRASARARCRKMTSSSSLKGLVR